VTFSAAVPDGTTIDWYTAASGGSIVSGGATVTSITSSLTATTTYHAQARNTATGCVSAARTAVSGTIYAEPAVSTQPQSLTSCNPAFAPVLTVGITPGAGTVLSYQWKRGPGAGTNVGTSQASYTPTVTGMAEFWVVVTDNYSCSVTSNKAAVATSGSTVGRLGTGAAVCASGDAGLIGTLSFNL
jgi:hypothetical protein